MRPEFDLVLFTSTYPFGNRAEPFLEPELEVLADRFRHIFLLPSHGDRGVRPVPDNVHVVEMPWLEYQPRSRKMGALLTGESLAALVETLRARRNWRPYCTAHRTYLDLLSINVLKYRMLRRFVRERDLEKAIFYDYWFENSTLALSFLRRGGEIGVAVSRAHGFDVYDERWDGLPVPFREAKLKGLDAVFVVSEHGREYMAARAPEYRSKLRRAHLGARRQPQRSYLPNDIPSLVSCGAMIPEKRIHLIPPVLASLGRRVKWTHLGHGPERARVEAASRRLPSQVEWDLPGHLDHAEVLDYYRSTPVDIFLSVSETEGVPVSMMEALSFGIPVVATGVGGVPEIVTPETGILVPPDAGDGILSAALISALEPGRFSPETITAFFLSHYEARSNYGRFSDALHELAVDSVLRA